MTIQQLIYVITISEAGSLNKAAETLYISQPSLTSSMQELEKELGITIFNRSGRGVSLTNDGLEFMQYARHVVQQYDRLMEKYGNGEAVKKRIQLSDNAKKAIKIGAAIVATGLIAYGGYKLYQNRGMLQNYARLGKKNVDFIRNSGKFESLSAVNESEISSKITESVSETLNNSDVINHVVDSFNGKEKESMMFDPNQFHKLTDNEMRSLQAYTTNWYHDINHFFRKDSEPIRDVNIIKGMCDGISSAFSKVSLSSDVMVSRGIDASTSKNLLLTPEIYDKLMQIKSTVGDYSSGTNVLEELKGHVNMDPGIMSTSYNTTGKVIESFSGKMGVIIDAQAKKGQHGIVMQPFSEAPYEYEIAFSPNSVFQFTGEYKIVNGIVHLMADIVQ